MAYSGRSLSPGGRAVRNQGRASDSRVNDGLNEPYRSDRHSSYVSPRSSGGVVPISSETFVTYPPSQTTRSDQQRYDSYGRLTEPYSSTRPRQTSFGEAPRGSTSSVTQTSGRTRPTVVQNDPARPTSPQKIPQERDYYVTPNTSTEPRRETHRKVYSVNDGTANLVADVNVPKDTQRHHRRRESDTGERGGYIRPPSERDSARRGYHLNGPVRRADKTEKTAKSVEDEGAYSYTNAAGMFRDTEPSWRDRERDREIRPRRNSVDRAGGSRERPVSMLDPVLETRRQSKEIGPPPSLRGWDKINDMSRSQSVRERTRDGPQSPTRAKVPLSPPDPRMPSPTRGRYTEPATYGDSRDPYYVAPRIPSTDDRRYLAANQDRQSDRYDQSEYREPRRQERRNSTTRVPDHSVERRGFGIRGDSKDRYGRDSSIDRYGRESSRDRYGRDSSDAFTPQTYYRDSGYAVPEPPHRRDTAPELSQHDEQRLEQEKRDRLQDREVREREPRSRGYSRDYDRDRAQRRDRENEYDLDTERERERERMMQPQPEPEKHHYRTGSYRDREYDRSPRDTSETITQPGLSTAAASGIAGAAAAYGVASYQSKSDERDRDRGRGGDQDRLRDRSFEHDRERVSPRPAELRTPQDTRPLETHSDEGLPYQQEKDRYRNDNQERGLGFAFEKAPEPPEPPKSAPPVRDRADTATSRESVSERDFERTHEDDPPVDPDEDYRRRKEQIQRELGRPAEDRSSDSDPDRERRRREREQRQREREQRNGESPMIGTNSTYSETAPSRQMPGSYDNDSVEGEDSAGGGQRTLRRRRSILDEPMTNEPVQIIDNSMSEKRETRVQIVEPPTEEEERKPKGILKKPKDKFPEHPDEVREGVAPLKDAKNSLGIPPGARWTKIDRRLVNPDALEEAKERFEERQDCVIVLRVLTKEDVQRLADRTKVLRDEKYYEKREDKRAARRRDRQRDRRERDEYEDDEENEFKPRAPKMLEAPSSAGASTGDGGDYVRESKDRRRDRDGDRDSQYVSRRDDYSER